MIRDPSDHQIEDIINDIDTIMHRIAALGPLQSFNSAVEAAGFAKRFMTTGRLIIRQRIEDEKQFNNLKAKI